MDALQEIDLASTLLSLILATGFIAFIILVIRTIFIAIEYIIYKLKRSKGTRVISKDEIDKKGF